MDDEKMVEWKKPDSFQRGEEGSRGLQAGSCREMREGDPRREKSQSRRGIQEGKVERREKA